MARINKKFVRGNEEFVYLTHADKQTRKDIAKQYNVPVKSVTKLGSYMATFTRKKRKR